MKRRMAGLAVMALAAMAAGCGSGDGPGADNKGGGGEPQSGGSVTFATFMPTMSFDPVVNYGYGVSGGIELLAVYDSVMRWNPEKHGYEPRTAESLTPNQDFTEWSLKIKPGIKFTDGTPYDAAAVKFSLDRHRVGAQTAPGCEDLRACPTQNTSSKGYMTLVGDVEQVDDLTLTITTPNGWPGMPMILAGEPGMVPSPTAVRKACPEDGLLAECKYGESPVGAGPFKVSSFRPGESADLVRNDAFYRGAAYLDALKFVSFSDSGSDTTAEALKSRQIQAAFLRSPSAIAIVNDVDLEGYSAVQEMGRNLMMNARPGAATHDVRVRKAVNAAIDRNQLNDRVYGGKAIVADGMFTDDYPFGPGGDVAGFDREQAKALVAEAKAAGWNGKIRLFGAGPERQRMQALKAMLDAVGMSTEVKEFEQAQLIEQTNVKQDFDLVLGGLPVGPDDAGIMAIRTNLRSDSLRNRTGYQNDALDAALDEMFASVTTEEKQAAIAKVGTAFDEGMPWVVEGAMEERVAWANNVHGIYANQVTEVYLDQAWIN
ncbi:ABC transporter substrate-binding protein [Nocardioides sp. Bht2]|uniref:ABC transporter substrate-binding protein n=1 Tax=Nocardioides sp. Bht2 TaxID=3392297 RepID=UPI0039B53805